MDKNNLRQEIRLRKRQFTAERLRELSLAVTNRLLSHPRIKQAKTIMLYHSLPDEVYTHDVLDTLVAAGKRVLLPVVIDGEHLEIRIYRSKADLQIGAMNILEPVGEPFSNYSEIEIIAVPGMSFDAQGHRLGRGKGYYDRFLAQVPQAYKIGICFDFQKVDEVPSNAHDIMMNEVL